MTLAAALALGPLAARAAPFTVAQALDYPFEYAPSAAKDGSAVAWVRMLRGVRNVWLARAPDFTPRQVTAFTEDDGQELTGLAFSPDGARLIFVRGGDHDANWMETTAPNPASSIAKPEVELWRADASGAKRLTDGEGDFPAVSSAGEVAFVRDGAVWAARADGTGKTERLFFDRGHDSDLAWSPDGKALAFVSERGDHAFIGVFTGKDRPIHWLAPSTSVDATPLWSPDGTKLAFVRREGAQPLPRAILAEPPEPWSIWTADPVTGEGQRLWHSPPTANGAFPELEGGASLRWAGAARLVFVAETDGWPHLYALELGGPARLLTPGPFMVEHVSITPDGSRVIFDANTGPAPADLERRHIFAVSSAGGAVTELTSGEAIEDQPAALAGGQVAFVAAGARVAPGMGLIGPAGERRLADGGAPTDFPVADLVTPLPVAFQAADGTTVHGQLFRKGGASEPAPGVIFVHGGPPRQMLLGWHYMDYYSNAYAVNQALAARGFVVLSVNYRLGIGYGRAFQHPKDGGPRGAAEYRDVLAGARFLQGLPGVDPKRIGMWGGSYGGYLTALALARNSDIFAAGVDWHGVHDWWPLLEAHTPRLAFSRIPPAELEEAKKLAFASSPVADVARWRSPVLLIQGDDDRNVDFTQTVDLAARLAEAGAPAQELVIPDEIHGFLRYAAWLKADQATIDFLERHLAARP